MALYHLDDPGDLAAPTLIAALDGWVDAGAAATTAAGRLAEDGPVVARFDGDQLFDYRARRPTLDIVDGRLAELTWPELVVRRGRLGDRDLLVLFGAEPDYRWQELSQAVVEVAERLGVAEWISLGSIPAAVPHTRDVPIMGTEAEGGRLRGGIKPGPQGLLRVPSAALSVLEMTLARAGVPAVGHFAQIPHYVSGPYAPAAVALLRALGLHFDAEVDVGPLEGEARQLRERLDTAAAAEETTRVYVARLEAMVDESRLPSGDELISEIERFLRERGSNDGGRS